MAREQRREDRAPTEIKVQYRTVGSFLSDYATNFSPGGVFIHTENPLPVGSNVRLIFSLPQVPVLFDVSGVVKWIKREDEDESPSGMGIQFEELGEKVRKRFEDYVHKLSQEVPSALRIGKRNRPTVEVKKMSGSSPERRAQTQYTSRPLGRRRKRRKD
ncbi:MAG: TIGR02266 family protein [Deltaproteobacteria bacterium]|nr:TIGR02266 family protein [Deltaproteobacteria bacterium]